jgi:hypothetical protein
MGAAITGVWPQKRRVNVGLMCSAATNTHPIVMRCKQLPVLGHHFASALAV